MKNIKDVETDYKSITESFGNNEVVVNNLESIINDFEFMHSGVSFEDTTTDEEMQITKNSLLATFICGVICAVDKNSNFHKELKLPDSKKVVEVKKSQEFANKIML